MKYNILDLKKTYHKLEAEIEKRSGRKLKTEIQAEALIAFAQPRRDFMNIVAVLRDMESELQDYVK